MFDVVQDTNPFVVIHDVDGVSGYETEFDISVLKQNYPWGRGEFVDFPGVGDGIQVKVSADLDVSTFSGDVDMATVFRYEDRVLTEVDSGRVSLVVEEIDTAHMFSSELGETYLIDGLDRFDVEVEVSFNV